MNGAPVVRKVTNFGDVTYYQEGIVLAGETKKNLYATVSTNIWS